MVKVTPSVKASTFEASCELFTVARVARRRLRNGFLCYHIWKITTRHDDQTPSPSPPLVQQQQAAAADSAADSAAASSSRFSSSSKQQQQTDNLSKKV